jgi:surfeit locus 1 family protein
VRFRPLFWPTVFTIPAVLVLAGLGVWQLERLQWKQGLLAAMDAPPAPLPRALDEARHLEFRRVTARGIFLHQHEIYRYATGEDGKTGVEVVTPLRLTDGALLLVDRGFVPEALKDPAKRSEGQIPGEVQIEGRLRVPHERSPILSFLPDNRPEKDFWLTVDPAAMAKRKNLDNVLPFYVDAGPAPNPGGWPKGIGAVRIRNDHLQYAITWFSLAVALAVIYVLYHRHRTSEDRSAR